MSENKSKYSELFDLKSFARLRKDILLDLTKAIDETNVFLQRYPRKDIMFCLSCPDKPRSVKILRELSHFFYAVSPQYRRAIAFFANLSLNNYILRPLFDTDNTEISAFNEEYIKLARTCKKYRFKREIPKMLTHCLVDGIFYGIILENDQSYILKHMPVEYCRITSVEDGVLRFSFDLNYFTSRTLCYLPQYGRDFEIAYEAYKGSKEKGIVPDKTKRWYEPRNQVCVKFDEEFDWIISPFAGLFDAIIDLDTYEEVKKDKAVLENYKLIHYKIPIDSDGVPKIQFEQAKRYYDMTAAIVPEGIGVVMSPFDVDNLTLKSNTNNDGDYVKEATKQLFDNFGISPILFGLGDNPTSQTLEFSTRIDTAMIYKVIMQIAHVFNVKLKKENPKYLCEIEFLQQSIFNKDAVADAYLKAAQYGMCSKLYYAAAIGLEPIDIKGMTFMENTFFNATINVFNRPLMSSHTSSGTSAVDNEGGRPLTDTPSDSTEKQPESNDR